MIESFDYEIYGSDFEEEEEIEEIVIEEVVEKKEKKEKKEKGKATQRARFSSHTKWLVAYEQDYKCAICRAKLPPSMEIDHRKPLWAGGSNERDNIWLLCPGCHATKTFLENERRYRLGIAKQLRDYPLLPLNITRPLSAEEKVLATCLVALPPSSPSSPSFLVLTQPPALMERPHNSDASKKNSFICATCGDVVSPWFRHACDNHDALRTVSRTHALVSSVVRSVF